MPFDASPDLASVPATREPRAPARGDAANLLTWFARHERPLPWRADRTPYSAWVSEVMLQQTRASVVAPYYTDFIRRFPDVRTLAAAPLEAVLKAWEGLGYYRRARLMHRAAGVLVRDHGARLPGTVEELRRLPGLGPYTAAAVAALGFGRATIAVDANVRRVGARFLGLARPADRAIVAAFTPWLDDAPAPPRLTEALIELGAIVCTPRNPACSTCPLRARCVAAAQGDPEAFPDRAPRKPPPVRRAFAVLHSDADGVWLAQRPAEGLLGGLWGVPQVASRPPGTSVGSVRHAYSHFLLELEVVRVPPPESAGPLSEGGGWGKAQIVPWRDVRGLAISGVDAKVLALAGEPAVDPDATATVDRPQDASRL